MVKHYYNCSEIQKKSNKKPCHIGVYILKPPIANLYESEVRLYYLNCSKKDEELFRWLPSVCVSSSEEAEAKLNNLIDGMLFKRSITYCIRPKELQIPVGYIVLNSPRAETGLNDWSIDFWMVKAYRGQGIMKGCLNNVLVYLQKMQVPVVKALVEKENIATIKLLQKLGFGFVNEERGSNRLLFAIRLNNEPKQSAFNSFANRVKSFFKQ